MICCDIGALLATIKEAGFLKDERLTLGIGLGDTHTPYPGDRSCSSLRTIWAGHEEVWDVYHERKDQTDGK